MIYSLMEISKCNKQRYGTHYTCQNIKLTRGYLIACRIVCHKEDMLYGVQEKEVRDKQRTRISVSEKIKQNDLVMKIST